MSEHEDRLPGARGFPLVCVLGSASMHFTRTPPRSPRLRATASKHSAAASADANFANATPL